MEFFWRYREFFLRAARLRSATGPCTTPRRKREPCCRPGFADFGIDTEGDRQSGGGSNVQFVFADHTLDIDRRELRRGAEPIAVEPQVLDLLIYVVQNRNRVVTKDDLIASIWGGRIVSDATLTSRIYAARKAVGDDGHGQKLIRTIARKGLRFVGDVHTQMNGHDTAPPSEAPIKEGRKPSSPVLAAFRESRHCRAAVRQHVRRSGPGVFFGRNQRGSHHGAIQIAPFLRDRP